MQFKINYATWEELHILENDLEKQTREVYREIAERVDAQIMRKKEGPLKTVPKDAEKVLVFFYLDSAGLTASEWKKLEYLMDIRYNAKIGSFFKICYIKSYTGVLDRESLEDMKEYIERVKIKSTIKK